ncbi:unnamed protein product [Paramecium primaurelia]|uniref:Uncharacterized protein n=1 Tax=Paramecium primaurelia TaxID=5886 RepID=A0A8S1N8D4_PARPR|nr:unnamed protein product [Paramecium primaurelia]
MISIMVVCLDSEYESQCPLVGIRILRSLSIIPIMNEVKKSIIPMIKELPPKWIRPLILSSFMMAIALIISLIYTLLKITLSLLMNLLYIILIVLILLISFGIIKNTIHIPQNLQQYFEYIKFIYK